MSQAAKRDSLLHSPSSSQVFLLLSRRHIVPQLSPKNGTEALYILMMTHSNNTISSLTLTPLMKTMRDCQTTIPACTKLNCVDLLAQTSVQSLYLMPMFHQLVNEVRTHGIRDLEVGLGQISTTFGTSFQVAGRFQFQTLTTEISLDFRLNRLSAPTLFSSVSTKLIIKFHILNFL